MSSERFLSIIWDSVTNRGGKSFIRIQDVFVLISEMEKFLSVRNLLIEDEIRLLVKMMKEKSNLQLYRNGVRTFLTTLVHLPTIEDWLRVRGNIQAQDLAVLVRNHDSRHHHSPKAYESTNSVLKKRTVSNPESSSRPNSVDQFRPERDQPRYSLDQPKYSLDQSKYALDQPKYSLDRGQSRYSLDQSKYSLDRDQPKYSLDQPRYSSDRDQSRYSLDRNQKRYSLDPDSQLYDQNSSQLKNKAQEDPKLEPKLPDLSIHSSKSSAPEVSKNSFFHSPYNDQAHVHETAGPVPEVPKPANWLPKWKLWSKAKKVDFKEPPKDHTHDEKLKSIVESQNKLLRNQEVLIQNLETKLYGGSTMFDIYRFLKTNSITKRLPIIRNTDFNTISSIEVATKILLLMGATMAGLAIFILGVFITLKSMRLVLLILQAVTLYGSEPDYSSDEEIQFSWIHDYPWLEYQLYSMYDTFGY